MVLYNLGYLYVLKLGFCNIIWILNMMVLFKGFSEIIYRLLRVYYRLFGDFKNKIKGDSFKLERI